MFSLDIMLCNTKKQISLYCSIMKAIFCVINFAGNDGTTAFYGSEMGSMPGAIPDSVQERSGNANVGLSENLHRNICEGCLSTSNQLGKSYG